MMELINIVLLAVLASLLLLRKVLVRSSTLTDNAASFVNQTADRLHMRKLVGRVQSESTNLVIGDAARSSLDEIPVDQSSVNNSRAHIAVIEMVMAGGTAAVKGVPANIVLTFERNQLFLDPDEAWFMNNQDIIGAPDVGFTWNIWYED